MKHVFAFIFAFLILTPHAVGATLLSEVPAHFMVDVQGQAAGVTESGLTFSQTNVANGFGVRLQKFTIGPLAWYVSDQGVIFAESDLVALSIYMARV